MGISEVVTLAVIGHMEVLGTAVGMLMVPGYLSLLNFVICNTLFVKQESKLVTCGRSGDEYSRLYYGTAGGHSQGL